MFKILLSLLLMTSFAQAQQWRGGVNEQTILGTSQASLIGFNSYNKIVKPLDSLLATYCNQYIQYLSNSTLTISAGSVAVSNSQGTIRLFLQNTTPTTISFTNIDTGSEAASTTYYVYAIGATNAATAATYLISASSTAPSGATYYYQIGSFSTDSAENVTGIVNNWWNSYVQSPLSKSVNVPYQALTDLFVGCSTNISGANQVIGIETGSISGSMVEYPACGQFSSSANFQCSVGWPIRKGDFYKLIGDGVGATCYAIPTGK